MIEHRRPGRRRDLIEFTESAARVQAKLGVITVGEITINPAGGRNGFFWACWLTPCPRTPQGAHDLAAAKRALIFQIRQWIEAAGLKQRGD